MKVFIKNTSKITPINKPPILHDKKGSIPESNCRNITTGSDSIAASNIIFHGLSTKSMKKLEEELAPIKTFKEYKEVLERVYTSKTKDKNIFWSPEDDLLKYKNIKKSYIGLLPYCGTQDVSYEINRFLSGKIDEEKDKFYVPDRISAISIIRAMDYSLDCLDKDVGKFEGIVFRKGFFDKNSKQYYSCSKSPKIAASFHGYNPDNQYSIIITKSGHKICDFQKKMKNNYAEEEEEILLQRNSNYRRLPASAYNEEIIDAIDRFTECLLNQSKYCNDNITRKLTLPEAKNLIKIYVHEPPEK